MTAINFCKTIVILLILVCPFGSSSQNIQQIEIELNESLKRIELFADLSQHDNETTFDSLLLENIILKEKLINFALQHSEMFTYDFTLLRNNNLTIATSPDRKFRIFSWDLHTGGTMRFFDNVYIYENENKRYAKSSQLLEGSPGGFYSDIFQVKDEQSTFYLGYQHRILSSRDHYQCLQIFNIEKDSLLENLTKILTKSGFTNTLGFSFNFFSVVDKKERPIRLITYNSSQKMITIPVVDENGYVSKKKIIYKYNGNYFTKQSSYSK